MLRACACACATYKCVTETVFEFDAFASCAACLTKSAKNSSTHRPGERIRRSIKVSSVLHTNAKCSILGNPSYIVVALNYSFDTSLIEEM